MFRRLTRTISTLLLLLTAYGMYSRLIVPLIEPAAHRPAELTSTAAERRAARDAVRLARAELAPWFAPGDWELRSSKILETPQGKLLLDQYQNLGQGRVRVRPCTMILWPQGRFASEQERRRRAIVVQAPSGAILQFDSDFNLKQGRVGKLVGGKLVGKVLIRSDYKQPGPQDDLLLTAREVYLTEEQLTSAHQVQFRLGESHGQGRELLVRLGRTPGADGLGGAGRTVRTVELLRDVRLSLQQQGGGLFAGLAAGSRGRVAPLAATLHGRSDGQPPALPASGQEACLGHGQQPLDAESGPVEIACEGPFRFDMEHQVATFERRVTVRRRLQRVAPDALDCELLAIHFQRAPSQADRSAAAAADANHSGPHDPEARLVPTRIVATGNPVVVESPLYGVSARATRIEYDLQSGMVRLHDRKQALLRILAPETGAERQMRATTLEYTPDPEGQWGTLLATGPGWLRGWFPMDGQAEAGLVSQGAGSSNGLQDAGAGPAEVCWERHMHFRPHEGLRLLSLAGPARVALPGRGSLAANEIHMWLSEATAERQEASPTAQAAPESPGARLVPERLLAMGNVEIDSPQFVGSVSNLQVWFEQPSQAWHSETGMADDSALVDGQAAAQMADLPALSAAHPSPALEGQDAPPFFPALGESGHGAGPYDIEAELLQARLLLLHGRTLVPLELRAQGGVRLRELAARAASHAPLAVDGDLVHLLRHEGATSLSLVGAPATFSAANMMLVGNQIRMEQATDLVAIDGPGQMHLDLTASLAPNIVGSQAAPADDRLSITWRQQFELQGRTARFLGSVVARRSQEVLTTHELLAEFTAPLRLERSDAEQPRLARLTCPAEARLERRSVQRGQTQSIDRLFVRDLDLEQQSGRLVCRGPGWLHTTALDRAAHSALGSPVLGGTPDPKRAAASTEQAGAALGQDGQTPRLSFLGVEFQQTFTGNLHQRELAFVGEVRAVYGYVSRWDETLSAEHPELLGEHGFTLQCERLAAAEMGRLPTGDLAYDLEASGGTIIEGANFTAHAHRMTYSQAKDLLLFEGTGRDDAKLVRRAPNGSQLGETQARKIYYWRSRNRVRVEDIRGFDLNDLGLRTRG